MKGILYTKYPEPYAVAFLCVLYSSQASDTCLFVAIVCNPIRVRIDLYVGLK